MLFSSWKSVTNKIILLISLTFILITLSVNVFLYYQLEKKFYGQVEELMNTAFYSFGRSVDNAFYHIENAGNIYKTNLLDAITANKSDATFHEFTVNFLSTRPNIAELYVFTAPDSKHTSFRSYHYSNTLNSIKKSDSTINRNNPFFKAITAFGQHYRDSNIITFWTPSYKATTLDNQPLIATLFIPFADTTNKKPLGFIALSIRMETLELIVSPFTLGNHSLNILLDNNKHTAIHPHPQFSIQQTDADLFIADNLIGIHQKYAKIYNNSSYMAVLSEVIDSVGNFKCPNSLALSYRLHNGWNIMSVFYEYGLPFSLDSFTPVLVSINIFAIILFFILLTSIVNRALGDVNLIANAIVTWNKYDIYEWRLPETTNQREFKLFVDAFNDLYVNYRQMQNKLSDAILINEQLMNNELKVETRISQAVSEATAGLVAHNKVLDIAFSNLSELNELGKIISGSLNLEEISFAIYNRLIELVPINFFGILIFNADTNTLKCRTGILNGELTNTFTINIIEKNNIAIKCWEKNVPIFINNFDIEYMNHLLVTSYNPLNVSMSSQYYAPISDNDGQIGVFTIQSIYKGIFKEFNLDILSILHTYLSISIKNIISFEELQASVEQLNVAQTKLILSEKMASMGQLAAGISHEIKNPLNFVINFSELSNLLVGDIRTELQTYKIEAGINKNKTFTYVEDLTENLQLNIDKISEHSKRADKIIKGMLQLSRGKSGEFTPVQINDLISEYSKLAYHGLRATDPLFHVDILYDLDEKLGKVNVVSHNISRVVINIVANACVATFKKHKEQECKSKPEVKVSTLNMGDKFAISVWDNGIGIPKSNRDKVFNPFFTTKLSSEGTGLGLAISYDIIVVEHSGDITFETEENEFTEFKVILPKHL